MFTWIQDGGAIGYILILASIIGWSVMIWKFLSIFKFMKTIPEHANEVKKYLKEFDFTTYEYKKSDQLEIAVSHYIDPLYNGLNFIKVIATTSPLLGLLGTVWGILASFKVISQQGLDDPSLFASGISLALVTTVAGLLVAIPHFIGFNFISSLLTKAEKSLEKECLKG